MVSIIMPTYNSADWIENTIKCIQDQTYSDWELVITDDASTDETVGIIQKIQKNDGRIYLHQLEVNSGAAVARNNSLKYATGRYIAYLDSDDIWLPEKLEKQLFYMQNKDIGMCYADYDIIEEDGTFRKHIYVPDVSTYESFLRRPITCTLTIMFDTNLVDKSLLVMPDIRRGQDAATWLQVLKTGIKGYALHENIAKYRRRTGSLSNNKIKAIKRTWYLYRNVEHLSLPHACLCFVTYAINAVKKYS